MSVGATSLETAVDLSRDDLAELLGTFQVATSRLETAHIALREHVARLEEELSATRAQLHRARELAALGEMAAGIAHEVRNPLGSIKLFAEVLRSDLHDRPDSAATADRIVTAVDGLDAVVGDVLAFSRELRVNTSLCSAGELLEQAVAASTGMLVEGVEVAIDHSAGDRSVVADASLLHQALVNVVRNAYEAVALVGGGRVELGVAERRVLGPDGVRTDMDALVVVDTGPGVPDEVLGRIFNPFFTTRATGTGLGLAIVHRILDAHGGQVRIDSSTGDGARCGTTVELLLPQRGIGRSGTTQAEDSTPPIEHTHPARAHG
ncbi:MAG: ATP-binding protein [Planctomycetota bacterium]